MIRHYLKISLRELLKYRTQSIISILGLAIGFTAFLLGGYWLWWETHFDNFHPEADRLYCLTTEGLVHRANGADADLDQLHINDRAGVFRLLPEIEASCSFNNLSYTIPSEGENINIHGMESDTSFFTLFRADFISGTYKGSAPDGSSVILTQQTAHRLFGTTDCIGKEVVLDEQTRPVVAGVIRDYPGNTDLIFQFLLIRTPRPNQVDRMTTYVRLQKTASVSAVRTKLAGYKSLATNRFRNNERENWKIHLLSASDVHLNCHPELTDRIRNIRILALAGAMAFLSALINLLVLFIGQQQRKQQKNRTYICLGASTRSLLAKGFTELALPLFTAFLIAVSLIEIIYPYYDTYTSWNRYGIYKDMVYQLSRPSLLWNTLLLAGCSMALFFIVCYFPVRGLLQHKIHKPALFKRGLIVIQIFIGSLFFITSLILFRQLHYILSKDKGITYEHIIQVDLGYDAAWHNDLSVLKPEMANHPFVESVTYTADNAPVLTEQGDWYGSLRYPFCFAPDESNPVRTDILMIVDRDFFTCFGLQTIAGKPVTDENRNDLLVNETAFKQLGYDDLVGHPIYNRNKQMSSLKVSGVINDYLYAPMQYPVQPLFFGLHDNPEFRKFGPAYLFYVRYTPGHKKEVMEHLREVTSHIENKNINRDNMFTELTDLVNRFNRPEKIIFSIFSILSVVCILISTFGIYSLVSLSAEQRRKEIAIRKVNGATVFHILHLFSREYLLLVMLGNVFALPIGYLLGRQWLETYANHTTLPLWLFLLVFGITSLIVLLSIFRQVIRAAASNPAETVKAE